MLAASATFGAQRRKRGGDGEVGFGERINRRKRGWVCQQKPLPGIQMCCALLQVQFLKTHGSDPSQNTPYKQELLAYKVDAEGHGREGASNALPQTLEEEEAVLRRTNQGKLCRAVRLCGRWASLFVAHARGHVWTSFSAFFFLLLCSLISLLTIKHMG
ncbi:hypothetical protein HPP92_009383 [Vanilla planifolia]|uniref:Uncharacterized protein n=1 Tax=Vanilla planifolia TaxID=51239 RepID=A0A835RBF1_VANPL|nr:hypothetical protein HPP92_009383 [Vanilla planifolia]